MSDFIIPRIELRPTPDRSSVLVNMFFREHQNEVPIRGADIGDRTVTHDNLRNETAVVGVEVIRGIEKYTDVQIWKLASTTPRTYPQPHALRGKSKAYAMPHPDIDPSNPDDVGFVPVTNARSSMEPDIGEVHEDYYEDDDDEY